MVTTNDFLFGPKNKWIRIGAPLALIVVFFLYVFFGPSMGDRICTYYEEDKNYGYHGVVRKKFIDTLEHGYPILVIERFSGSPIRLNLTHDISGLFEYAEVNDTLKKDKGSYDILLRRNSSEKTFVLDYGCENK